MLILKSGVRKNLLEDMTDITLAWTKVESMIMIMNIHFKRKRISFEGPFL
jgi:hypothetical protein